VCCLGFLHFILHDVLYLPKLQRKLLSSVHIQQQGHYIHMFDGEVETNRSSHNMLIMIGWEDGRLLKLKGTFAQTHNFAYLSHHDEGTSSSSLLWHVRFGYINYDIVHMLNKNGVYVISTIPRNLQQCESCILSKHNKQHFHDSTSRAHRKIELIHSNLCVPMPIPSSFGYKYIITFIDDSTMMCWI
jgi:hypothetical protein